MSHQTIIIREEDTTLRIDQVTVPSRISSKITLPVGGDPFTFCDENGNLLLTIDKDGNIISEKGFFELSGQAAPAVSPAGKMRLYFDFGTNKLRLSENGGAYAGLGDVVGPASATDDALVRWDVVTGKLVQDSNALLNDAGDLTLVGSQSLGKFLNVAGIAAPALSSAGEARLYFDSTSKLLLVSEDGGAFKSISGDLSGPALSTDDALARFDGVTGKLVKNSSATLTDAGNLSINGELQITGQYVAPVRFSFESANDWRFTRGGAIKFSIGSGGGLDSGVNQGHTITGQAPDSASAVSVIFNNFPTLSTAGALLMSVRNNSIEKFSIDKDGIVNSAAYDITTFQKIRATGAGNSLLTLIGSMSSAGIKFQHSNNQTYATLLNKVIASSGDEVIWDIDLTVNKVAGNYTGLKLNVVEIAAPGSSNLLLDLAVGGVSKFFVFNDGSLTMAGDLDHDGSNVGFYGTAPAAQAASYTRNATIVEDRTLLASASATTLNNNNVLAAIIADLQAVGLFG